MKFFWAIPGILFLVLGVIGLILPVIPQVPFLLISLYCFCRMSDRLKDRIREHPLYKRYPSFGKMIAGEA
ncbi:MAG: DUF454 family protein [Eubacterium sp.]|nr:DUF454 family protein [Eubacterium sp.]